jgi:hypothetical protein
VTASSPHLVSLLVTLGVGLVMCRMGLRERRLLPRKSRGKCASCGRHLGTRRKCEHCD